MNDNTKSAESSPHPTSSETRPPDPDTIWPGAYGINRFLNSADRPFAFWLKRFLVCNPFYLASAALLLFGLYRLSLDPGFLPEETGQLVFNFTSLQLYEMLLVGTAMLLARRLICYDAGLLVALENLLVLVPFMLISQAALIEPRTVWLLCGAAVFFAVARSALAQRGVRALRFPPRLALLGGFVLLVNAAWPVIYRSLHQNKFGTKLESGTAYEVNLWSWLLLLPVLIALANLLPGPREDGRSPVQGRRFPVGLFALWLLGSAAHLYSLGYVYDFDLHCAWIAPALWAAAWTLYSRLPDHADSPTPVARRLTLSLPLGVTLLAANASGSHVCFALNVLNLFAFASIAWKRRDHHLALHLALLALGATLATMPANVLGAFHRSEIVALAAAGYVMVATLLTRNPKAAIAGALAAGLVCGAMHQPNSDAWYWAGQGGVVFFLLHTLRWRDHEHPGATGVRNFAVGGWLFLTLAWLRDGAATWHPLATGGGVLLVWSVRGWVFQRWRPLAVPGAAIGVALSGPANLLVNEAQTAPVGVLALAGSLLLFAVGTAVALTKHRWFKMHDAG